MPIAATTALRRRRSNLSKPVRAPETPLRNIMRKIYIMCVVYMYIIIDYTYIYTVTPRGEPAKATRSLGFVRAAFLSRTVICTVPRRSDHHRWHSFNKQTHKTTFATSSTYT